MALEARIGRVEPRAGGPPGSVHIVLENHGLSVGDVIHIRGPGSDLHERIRGLLNGQEPVQHGHPGEELEAYLDNLPTQEAGVFLVSEDQGLTEGPSIEDEGHLGRIPFA